MSKTLAEHRNEHATLLKIANDAMMAGNQELAIASFGKYLEANPHDPQALFNVGKIHHDRREYETAANYYERTVNCDFSSPIFAANAMNNLGIMAGTFKKHEYAAGCFMRALLLDSLHIAARVNLADAFRILGEFEKSAREYDEVLLLAPDSQDAKFASSMLALLFGDLEKGFRLYESRWESPSFTTQPMDTKRPKWTGEWLGHKTILLTGEQGFGDAIQFIRYADLIRVLHPNCEIIFHGHAALSNLFRCADGVDKVLEAVTDHDFDYHCPLLSLPAIFGTKLDNIPSFVPYFDVTAADFGDGTHIGLVWAGSPTHGRDNERSIPAKLFLPIVEAAPDAKFYSLQVGTRASEIKDLPIQDISPLLTDWKQTAEQIAGLDLVITVDTAVAHLSGALGTPVYLLLPTSPDWRWMLNRTDSLWYPSTRLFRQKERGKWEGVIAEIVEVMQEAKQ